MCVKSMAGKGFQKSAAGKVEEKLGSAALAWISDMDGKWLAA